MAGRAGPLRATAPPEAESLVSPPAAPELEARPPQHAGIWASPTRRRALLGGALLGGCAVLAAAVAAPQRRTGVSNGERIEHLASLSESNKQDRHLKVKGAEAWGTCIVTIAVGQAQIEASKIASRTRQAYATKKGYRNMFYHFANMPMMHAWCSSTKMWERFQWEDVGNYRNITQDHVYSYSLVRYCAISSAILDLECEKVLYMDPGSVIVNDDVDASLAWPGTEDKGGDRHVMWAYAQWPVGLDSDNRSALQVVDHEAGDWCLAEWNGWCGSYDKFASCVSPGALLVDNSPFSRAFLDRAVQTLLDVPRENCSTGELNEWSLDQCSSDIDSCMAACSVKYASKNAHREEWEDITIPEEEFVCAGTGDGPRFQEVMVDNATEPDKNTFIVSCPGSMLVTGVDEDQVNCIHAVMKMYLNLPEPER